MIFSTLQKSTLSILSSVLAAYRASGRISTVFAYRASGRVQTVLGCYRGAGRLAASTDYRGSEHGLAFGFITTRTNGYPVCAG